MSKPQTPAPTEKPKRVRANTPFDEAKRAQEKLDEIETKRRAIVDSLSVEASVMLEALDELRAKQSVELEPTIEPSSPSATRDTATQPS